MDKQLILGMECFGYVSGRRVRYANGTVREDTVQVYKDNGQPDKVIGEEIVRSFDVGRYIRSLRHKRSSKRVRPCKDKFKGRHNSPPPGKGRVEALVQWYAEHPYESAFE